MKWKASSRSSLFLMEMMISIIFFSIAAAGCVQVFAKAHTLSVEAEELNMAQNLCAGAIEEMSVKNAGTSMKRYYDGNWMECGQEQARYEVTVTAEEEQGMRHLQAAASEIEGKEIYSLNTDVYFPEGAEPEGGDHE